MTAIAALALAGLLAIPSAAPPAGVEVPFELLPTNHMIVSATINGKGPYRLIFDLGSPVTLVSRKAATATGLVKPGAPRSLFNAAGEAKVDSLKLGDLEAEGLPVLVMDHPALKALGQILGRPIDGLMGHTFFARYKTTIDYQARRMTFEPVDHAVRDVFGDLPARLAGPKLAETTILAPAGLWGLVLGEPPDPTDRRGLPVLSVLGGSAAEAAGLRPGDLLTTLDGRWTTTLADAFSAASQLPPGQPAPVVVERDGAPLTLSLIPRAGL